MPLKVYCTSALTSLSHRVRYLPCFTLFYLAKAVMRSHNKTFFGKVSRILTGFDMVFNFEKFLLYVLPKFK